MFEKSYRRKPKTVKAIQYDGTDECEHLLLRDYSDELSINYGILCAYLYYDIGIEITEGDWLLIEKEHVVGVVRRDDFDEEYEPV